MIVLVQIWVLLAFASAEKKSSIYTQTENLPQNITQVQWKWEDKGFEYAPQVGDIVFEEIATVPLRPNASCDQDIDTVIKHIPSIDNELSYETTYSNGSKTYTLFEVRTISPCSKDISQQGKRTRDRIFRGLRSVKRSPILVKRILRSQKKNMQNEPFQVPPVFSPQYSTAIVSCGPYCQCNGILVGPQHILTSSHCINSIHPTNLKVGFLGRGGTKEWYSGNRIYTPRPARHSILEPKYDYALIRLAGSPDRTAIKMRPAAISRGNDVTFWAFDSQSKMRKSTCASISAPYGLACEAIRENAGSGILLESIRDGYVVIGVLTDRQGRTSYRGQGRYLGTFLTHKKIAQIENWIKKL